MSVAAKRQRIQEEKKNPAQNYYDSEADNFYSEVWGGTDIHVGIYDKNHPSILEASSHTVEKMSQMFLKKPSKESRVADLGAGYGGSARFLHKQFGCSVDCLNISQVQNRKNESFNTKFGLQDKIKVIYGSFEDLPFPDETYDYVWSQDSFIHSDKRKQIISEIARVLKPGGELIFTDLIRIEKPIPEEVLKPILNRIHLSSIGSIEDYRKFAEEAGLEPVVFCEYQHQIVQHYSKVLEDLERKETDLNRVCSKSFIDNMKAGLKLWIQAGKNYQMTWGIQHYIKPDN